MLKRTLSTITLATSLMCAYSYGNEIDLSIVPDSTRSNANPIVQANDLPESELVKLAQWTAEKLSGVLRLYVKGQSQPVLGQCELSERGLQFRPRFPLQPGVSYIAEYRFGSVRDVVRKELLIPKVIIKPSTTVNVIYPTTDALPQNLLKFYIHFSAPMSQGVAYDHIELKSKNGKQLEHPFLEIAEELWDRSGKRLTLLLDPGRVKRGLVPREQDGPILVEGESYQLSIKSSWPDAQGVELAKPYTKEFKVLGEDFVQPNPANWRIEAPRAGTLDPLMIVFPEPLDHAVLTRGLSVRSSQDQNIPGQLSLSEKETRGQWKPDSKWVVGAHTLRISGLIEDLAGNSIERAFEVDRFDKIERSPDDFKNIDFEIR